MNLQPAFLVSCRLRAALYPPNLASPALWFLLALVTVVLFAIANSTFAAGRGPAAASPNFAAGHILVAPESGSANTDFQQALIAQGGHSLGRLHGTDVHMVGVPVGSEQDAVARLAGNPNVRFAELDQLASPAGSGADSDLRNELRLASIHAPETRTATTRDSTIGIVVTIAILDSGVDDAQPDLAGQLVPGWNFFDNNNDTSDAVGHGTAVAGAAVVASSADAGVAGSARIMPVRIADAAGYAYWSTAAQGLTWAADQGAQVANINFEGMAASSTMEAAAIYFRSKGGTIVVAAANTGRVGDAATAKRGPIHACKRGNPTITITPSQSAGVQAGTMVPFSVTVTNNDASACNVSTFDMSHSQPSGWTATFSSGVISLSPGASNSTTLQVTSPAATSDSSNPITATATNREANTSRGSASATYVVANAVPGAPSIGTATAGNTQATVSFTAPASNGGSAITSYTVTSNPGAISASGAASPITVPGLINGTAYTFTVQATNAVGTGPASAASNSVTPAAVATAPGAPTIGTATAGNTQATVSFVAPASNGGSAITSYKVTSSPGAITGTGAASPITVPGLTNGTAYTFTVQAINAVGPGAASAASNSVTPMAAGGNFYSTNFPNTENPISEGGSWVNGKTVGIDWQNVATSPGFAFLSTGNSAAYDDSTAILTGAWGPNQYVRATVKIPTVDQAYVQEIEIRLRSTMTANNSTGYEILGGFQIVRWNGAAGDFTVLADEGPYGVLRDGDVFEANMVGNVITVYINGVKVNRATDNTYSSGNPGMGFFSRNPSPAPFGFSSFSASNNP